MYQQNPQPPPQLPRLSSRDTPFSLILIGANVLTFLLMYFFPAGWLIRGLSLSPESLHFPWTWMTWPLLGLMNPFSLLCICLWMWMIGASLERSWGTQRLVTFFLATALVTSLTVLPFLVLSSSGLYAGLGLAIAPLTVAWCWINRQQTILFSYIFPVPALAIAAITVGMTFFGTAQALGVPWAGFLGLSGSAAAWWWVRGGREWFGARFGRKKHTPNLRFADLDKDVRGAKPSKNPFKKAQEEKIRQERDKKIAEMFRNSGYREEED